MTLKNALADIPFGGGKSVILGRPGGHPTEAELRVFGRWIDELGGRYVTAEDVGMRVADMRVIAEETRFVSGLGEHGFGGDPSPATAEGVLLGIRAAVGARLGRDSLEGVRVAVQGLGNVGFTLCRLLAEEGAPLIVADIDAARVAAAEREFGATGVGTDVIHAQPVDVLAPCALGGVLNPAALPALQAAVVAGSANNQLSEPGVADELKARGVLYAPDYVINAGGVVSVAGEYLRESGMTLAEGWVADRIASIPARLTRIFEEAAATGRSTDRVAEALALEVIEKAGRQDPSDSLAVVNAP
jgi:leucine dehydrogenase